MPHGPRHWPFVPDVANSPAAVNGSTVFLPASDRTASSPVSSAADDRSVINENRWGRGGLDLCRSRISDPARQLLGLLPLDRPRPEFDKSAYRNTKGRRVSGLSIGYANHNSTNTAAGNELTDLRHDSPQPCAAGATACQLAR